MGDYTTVRFNVKLHAQGLLMVTALHELNQNRSSYYPTPWQLLQDAYPLFDEYIAEDRHSFIPFGALSYCNWDDLEDSYSLVDLETSSWSVACSIKPCPAIEVFISKVLPLFISERSEVHTWFELDREPTTHTVEPRRPREIVRADA
jgi:hypothetical protein